MFLQLVAAVALRSEDRGDDEEPSTGLVFSGKLDTDIVLDYGVFAPSCRWADLSDIRQLDLHIDAGAAPRSGNALFSGWRETLAKLRVAARALK